MKMEEEEENHETEDRTDANGLVIVSMDASLVFWKNGSGIEFLFKQLCLFGKEVKQNTKKQKNKNKPNF